MAQKGRPKKVKEVPQVEVPQSPKTGGFTLVLEANNIKYQSEGDSILECLNNLKLDWIQVKTKGTITVTDGTLTSTKFLPLHLLRRVVSGKMMKVIWAKNLSVLLK